MIIEKGKINNIVPKLDEQTLARKIYRIPALTMYGDVVDLTRGGNYYHRMEDTYTGTTSRTAPPRFPEPGWVP